VNLSVDKCILILVNANSELLNCFKNVTVDMYFHASTVLKSKNITVCFKFWL
jgi:hypothetical protein